MVHTFFNYIHHYIGLVLIIVLYNKHLLIWKIYLIYLVLNLILKIHHLLQIFINNGMIEFDNVCFHYQPERPILKNVSCRILPGQTLANVESGLIKIGGTDIPTITQTHCVVNCTARCCFIQ